MTEHASPLTDARRRFADEFLVDFCAAAAYVRAGYKARGNSAAASASRLLARPEVGAYLAQRKSELSVESGLSLLRVTQELKAIALFDPRRLYDESGAMLPPSAWPDDVAAAIAGVDVVELSEQRNGKKIRVGQTKKLNLWNKLDAIEKALKLLDAYPKKKDDQSKTTIVGVVVLPAKQPYQGHQHKAIEGESRRIERTEPLTPTRSKFVVPLVGK